MAGARISIAKPGPDRLIKTIDAMGSMVAAVESGFARQMIDQAAFARSDQVESKERIIVGVNDHTDDEPPHMHRFEVGEEVRHREIDRHNEDTARRDSRAVVTTLKALRLAAADQLRNLMPPILAAVRAYCSIGEICGALREIFGEYQS